MSFKSCGGRPPGIKSATMMIIKRLLPHNRFVKCKLEDTARYAGLLIAPAEGFGLWPRLICPSGKKKSFFLLFWPIFGNFWCPVVTVVTFSYNLSNFEKLNKIQKKIQKNPKNFKQPKIKK